MFERPIHARETNLRGTRRTDSFARGPQQLLTFSKGGDPIRRATNLNQLIRDAATLVTRGTRSRCEFELAEDLWPAEIDPGQINQTIHNLVINATQAMPDGGTVRIRTENAVRDGNYAKIEIEDEGTGISPEHLPKIFDPYFTTKEVGSGLGLATTYSIIVKHGGHITVRSNKLRGTTFSVLLPTSQKEVTLSTLREEELPRGQGRILVLDDQLALLQMAGRMMSRLGYEVSLATDGSQAIDLFSEALASGSPFDVVVLDLTIPGGMGGVQVLGELQKLAPEVKAIVSSGYSTDPVMSNFQSHGFSGVLPKPYRTRQLAEVLSAVLDPQRSSRAPNSP